MVRQDSKRTDIAVTMPRNEGITAGQHTGRPSAWANELRACGPVASGHPNLAARLGSVMAPLDFASPYLELGTTHSGDQRRRAIIESKTQRTRKMGCFVAGTLVHTQDGSRPIEQIKVGDLVLSKREDDTGEASYEPVMRTFCQEDREVYFVSWSVPGTGANRLADERGYAVVTGAHPIWIQRLVEETVSGEGHAETVTRVDGWISIEELYLRRWKMYWEGCGWVTTEVQLLDGRRATLQFIEPVLQSDNPDVGVGFRDCEQWRDDPGGTEIRFEQHGPRISYGRDGLLPNEKWLPFDYEIDYDYTGYDTESPMSVVRRSHGYLPMRRTVFNLEVANSQNYFVTEMGLWVRDSSGD